MTGDQALPCRPTPAPLDGKPAAVPAICPLCGREVPVMAALVYHGIVYHPLCAFPGGELTRGPGR